LDLTFTCSSGGRGFNPHATVSIGLVPALSHSGVLPTNWRIVVTFHLDMDNGVPAIERTSHDLDVLWNKSQDELRVLSGTIMRMHRSTNARKLRTGKVTADHEQAHAHHLIIVVYYSYNCLHFCMLRNFNSREDNPKQYVVTIR